MCILVTAGFLGFITLESDEVSATTTWYVGSGPGNDTAYIGYAINVLANPGDTIFVHNGIYYDNLYIDKTITLIGEDKNTTIIDGMGGAVVVRVLNTEWVNVTGFTITNGTIGVLTYSSSSNNTYIYNIIRDLKKTSVEDNSCGFFFTGCPYSNNKVIENIVYNIEGDGIHLESPGGPPPYFWNNSLINNTVYNNTGNGIFIGAGNNNFVIGNNVHHNGLNSINLCGGIYLDLSHNNSIVGNVLHNNGHGITWGTGAWPSRDNTIAGNMIYDNNYGVRSGDTINNTYIKNLIFNNNYNVYMVRQCYDNKFINCTLSNATEDDFNLSEDSHAILLNTTFNKERIYYGDTLSTLTVKWFMHVKVIYYNGTPVSYADIWVNDTYGTPVFEGLAELDGWVRWLVVTEYLEQDMNGDHNGEKTYYTPHDDTATDGELWGYAYPNMDISKVVLIILGVPTHILPPTNLTTKTVKNGNNIELEWDPSPSPALDHYLVYRADSATGFDFTSPHNSSLTWLNPLNTTWVDPDSSVTAVDDDFYYIVRAANFDGSDISLTSNTAGVWTRTFESGISTFSLPLEPFVTEDIEYYCQDMNASCIKWMNQTTHTWAKHDRDDSGNSTLIEVGQGYEIGFDNQTRYTFCGTPGAMIIYDDDVLFSGFDADSEAKNLTVAVEPDGNLTLTWQEPAGMGPGDWYEVYYWNTRDGFFGTLGIDYIPACSPIGFGINSTTISGLGASDPGARLYFMVVPFNSMGVRGTGTYSIGIWTEEYLAEYDTFGIPLKMKIDNALDWYCGNIPGAVGINFYIASEDRWAWHSTRMPEGVYDPLLVMGEGYQISTSGATKFTFIGI